MRRPAFRPAVLLGASLLAAGCQTQVTGSGSFAGPSALPVPGGTSLPAPTPSGLPTTASPTPSVSTSGLPVPAAFPGAFVGTWTGSVSQPGSSIPTWTAVLTMPAGKTQGSFEVKDHCKGVLTLLTGNDAVLVALERITSDPNNQCANQGGVTMRALPGGKASFAWFDSADAANTASGTLTKM
jgi:hypothetical protein